MEKKEFNKKAFPKSIFYLILFISTIIIFINLKIYHRNNCNEFFCIEGIIFLIGILILFVINIVTIILFEIKNKGSLIPVIMYVILFIALISFIIIYETEINKQLNDISNWRKSKIRNIEENILEKTSEKNKINRCYNAMRLISPLSQTSVQTKINNCNYKFAIKHQDISYCEKIQSIGIRRPCINEVTKLKYSN